MSRRLSSSPSPKPSSQLDRQEVQLIEISVRNVSRLTVEVTIPLTDESMADPFNLAVEAVNESELYPDVCWEDSAIPDRWDFDRQALIVTLSEIV